MAIGTVATVTLLLSVLFKIFHLQGTISLFQIGIILYSVFGVWTMAITYFSSIKMRYKLMWMLLIVMVPILGVWIYHLLKK